MSGIYGKQNKCKSQVNSKSTDNVLEANLQPNYNLSIYCDTVSYFFVVIDIKQCMRHGWLTLSEVRRTHLVALQT